MHPIRPAWSPSLILLMGILAAGTILRAQESEPHKTPGPSRYVGAEVCQSCHEDQYKTFAASAHVQTTKNEEAGQQGCEGCHGPGAAHVDAGGDPEKIQRFNAGASAGAIQGRCTGCHAADLGTAHTKARLTCLTCHSPHHYQQAKSILVAPEGQLCQRCHRQGTLPRKGHH